MADRVTCRRFKPRAPCAGGVNFERLRDAELRLPCHVIDGVTGTLPCEHFEAPAAPPVPALGPLSKALELSLDGRCPACAEPTTGELDVGGQVVATPCHHQLRIAR
jgi:hypothetical protein